MERQKVELGKASKIKSDLGLKVFDELLGVFKAMAGAIRKPSTDNTAAVAAAREAAIACLTKEAVDTAKTWAQGLPLGGVLTVGAQLSSAFANGVIDGARKAVEALDCECPLDFSSDDAAIESAHRAHQRVGRATLYLGAIVREGLASLGDEALSLLVAKGIDDATATANDVFSQIGKQLLQQNEILSAVSLAVRTEAGRLSEARRAVYGRLFSFAMGTFVGQFGRPELVTQLKDVVAAGTSKEDFEAALLVGLLRCLALQSAAEYARAIHLAEGGEELRALLREKARELLERVTANGYALRRGDVPAPQLGNGEIVIPTDLSVEETPRERWATAGACAWDDYERAELARLRSEARHYQWMILHAGPLHPFTRLDQRYRDHVEEAVARARASLDRVVNDYGLEQLPAVEGYDQLEKVAPTLRRLLEEHFTIGGAAGLPQLYNGDPMAAGT